MQILVTGATDFLGSHLVPFLLEQGHTVWRLTRRPQLPDDRVWQPARGEIDRAALSWTEVIIHLAGESLGDGWWTRAKKQRIRDSRVQSTQLLWTTLASVEPRPRVLLSASAVGYYGDRNNELLTEQSTGGTGFLAEVCRQREAATTPAQQGGMRTVCLRQGVVLAPDGGTLHQALRLSPLGVGLRVGQGRQYWSWIALPDWVAVIDHCLSTPTLSGPVNVVAPTPGTNAAFASLLATLVHRPLLPPVPAFAVRLLLGELAEEVVLASARVAPTRLLASGYRFQHATLEERCRCSSAREYDRRSDRVSPCCC
jgi:uncharacterized protein (TIGR01777 family)